MIHTEPVLPLNEEKNHLRKLGYGPEQKSNSWSFQEAEQRE